MWQYNNTDELYHYGVLGMKWGHRKTISNFLERQANKNVNRSNKLSRKLNKHGIGGENGYIPEFAKRRNAQMMTKGLQDGKLKKIPKGYQKVGDKILTDKQVKKQSNKQSSNKKSKKMSTKKKVVIGAAVTAGILGAGYGAYKLSKIYSNNKKSNEKYKKAVKDIIKRSKTQSAKDAYYTNRSLDRELKRAMNNPWGGKQAINVLQKGGKMGRSSWGPRWSSDLTSNDFKHKNIQKALDDIEKLNKKYR